MNIILIGMTGCGKSTLARALGERLGRESLDSDELICEKAGLSVSEVFAQWGEEAFRNLETAALTALCTRTDSVIATGGGCVTRAENKAILCNAGVVIWLKRDLTRLAAGSRPLFEKKSAEKLYAERQPLYRSFADYEIDNNGTVEETVERILGTLREKRK